MFRRRSSSLVDAPSNGVPSCPDLQFKKSRLDEDAISPLVFNVVKRRPGIETRVTYSRHLKSQSPSLIIRARSAVNRELLPGYLLEPESRITTVGVLPSDADILT